MPAIRLRGGGKKKVCYFHGETIGEYYYGPGHPMKPHRLQMTHNLILSYSLYKKMDVYRPHWATDEEMSLFHSPDYVDFIRRVNPDNQHEPQFAKQLQRFTVGEDCPVFDGLYDYCRVYSGGTIDGAMKLNHGIAVRAPMAHVHNQRQGGGGGREEHMEGETTRGAPSRMRCALTPTAAATAHSP